MDAAKELEIARALGLDKPPVPRCEVPEPNHPIPAEFKPGFYKALALVDYIETWAFERFIPNFCVVDLAMDAASYSPGFSFAILMRTDVPPPSNTKIFHATGIKPGSTVPENYYRWLGIAVADHYRQLGASAMARPLIFRTKGGRERRGGVTNRYYPMIGAIMKFARKPSDGLTREDLMTDVGVLLTKPRQKVTENA